MAQIATTMRVREMPVATTATSGRTRATPEVTKSAAAAAGVGGGWGAILKNDDSRGGMPATANRDGGGREGQRGFVGAGAAQQLQLRLRRTWCERRENLEALEEEVSTEMEAKIMKVIDQIGVCFILAWACLLFFFNP